MDITTKFNMQDKPFTLLNNKVKQVTVRTIHIHVTPDPRVIGKILDISYAIEWDINTKAEYSEGGKSDGLALPKQLDEKLLFPSKAELLQSL